MGQTYLVLFFFPLIVSPFYFKLFYIFILMHRTLDPWKILKNIFNTKFASNYVLKTVLLN